MADDHNGREYEPVGEIARIFLRGRRWWVNYQFGGRQHRRSLKTTSKKEATRKALRIERNLLDGLSPGRRATPPSYETVRATYTQYLETERRAAKTMVKYRKVFERLAALLEARRAKTLLDLDLKAVDAYRQLRVASGVAEKTLYCETVIIRQLVNFALKRRLIDEDPLAGLQIREPKPAPQPCWTSVEVEQILAASPETHRAAFTVLADTGMRIAELRHLTHADLDFGRNVIHVRPKDGWQPKSGDQRAIPMTPRVAETLRALPQRGRWVFTARPSTKFPHGDNQVSERRLLRVLKRLLRDLGMRGHLHTFRHAFISNSLIAGVAEAIVRAWVGHVDARILQLYTHIASTASQSAMAQVAQSRQVPDDLKDAAGAHGHGAERNSEHSQHRIPEGEND
jgi:site-specific recombinase XerD